MPNRELEINLITYADNSLRVNESHVALAVRRGKAYYLFHATEDLRSESDMKYEMQMRQRDPLDSSTPHQFISLGCSLSSNDFDRFQAAMECVPVPKPKPTNWNCQSWLKDALHSMEMNGWLGRGMAGKYYERMMNTIESTSKAN